MKQIYQSFLFLLFAFVLSSCAQLGLKAPETFNQKVAVAYGTITQVRESATMLLEQNKITVQDAQHVQTTADTARQGIEAARMMHAQGSLAPAEQKIAMVRTVLQALSAYLASRQQ